MREIDVRYVVIPLRDRIDRHTEKLPDLPGCWLWTGGLASDGYPVMKLMGVRNKKVTRIVYTEYIEGYDPSLWVLHKCDTPLCVNPSHLFLGTNQDNTADRTRKNRQAKGERCNKNQLTQHLIKGIDIALAAGYTQMVIAVWFGTTQSNVSLVKRRINWKHI